MLKKYSRKEDWKVYVASWCPEMDAGVWEQTENMAKLPFVHHHIALMPDAHKGYGMPIGGVMATKRVVVPNAVGVDIGCGMGAIRMPLADMSTRELDDVKDIIFKTIPIGKNSHKEMQPGIPIAHADYHNIPVQKIEKARRQIGTLGGGNHFIEIQYGMPVGNSEDSNGSIYVMVHSGSRKVGHDTATHYNKVAQNLNKKWHSGTPPNNGLAFLPVDSAEGIAYLRDMNYCVEYAERNRRVMLVRVLEAIGKVKNTVYPIRELIATSINIAHNYATLENHYGKNVIVHRKGATQAREGQIGIIPGSQGSFSYITKGLGHPESFNSSSHGAGRAMSRRKAESELDLELEIKHLDDLGVRHNLTNIKGLQEADSAYKNIDRVMFNQVDLTESIVQLRPLAVVKG